MSKLKLPKLPEPSHCTLGGSGPSSGVYCGHQLQAYGLKCARQARLTALSEAKDTILSFQAGWVPDGFTECADAIERLKTRTYTQKKVSERCQN